jgi:hypothetical protein
LNAPMRQPTQSKPIKEIYASRHGIVLPPKVKRLLRGAEVVWFDKTPLSQDFEDVLHFFFESHTSPMTDMLLRRHGLTDVSQYVNIKFLWGVEMELHYSMPNRKEVDKHHVESTYFEFYGTIFPMHEKFKTERDHFYMLKQLEFSCVPDDHKNKKFYETTKFRAVVVNV